jgi:hypothetical protein
MKVHAVFASSLFHKITTGPSRVAAAIFWLKLKAAIS